MGYNTSQTHVKPFVICSEAVSFVSGVNIKTIVIVSPELNLCLTSRWQRYSQYFSTDGNTFD